MSKRAAPTIDDPAPAIIKDLIHAQSIGQDAYVAQYGVDPALIRRYLAGPIRVALQFWLERTP